jgi:hypothetical protein
MSKQLKRERARMPDARNKSIAVRVSVEEYDKMNAWAKENGVLSLSGLIRAILLKEVFGNSDELEVQLQDVFKK